MYFNSYKSNARGVTILVKDSCPITDIKSTIIYPGNLTKFNFTYKDEKFSLAALYAPNEKDIKFFETLFEAELDTDIDHTLYAGDWNVSLSQQMDTHGYLHENNTQNRDYIRKKMIEYDLKDIWRDRNPQAINYTFMKKQAKNVTKARLDFLLVGPKTVGYIEAIRIDGHNGLSDHRSFSCTIAKNKIENGPGYWRFNNQLLENPEMLFGMTHRIRRTIRNYATEKLPNDITDQKLTESPSSLSPVLLMDMVLCDARA